MASKLPPVKNEAFATRILLFARSDHQIKETPTIAAGDFKSAASGTDTNLATTPSESPTGSGWVDVELSAAEMNYDEIPIKWKDVSGDEWHSAGMVIHTVASGHQFDDIPIDTEIADAVLSRGVSNTEDAADTTSLTALILATLESSISGTTWTIRKTGGTTFVIKTATIDAGANPIVGVT